MKTEEKRLYLKQRFEEALEQRNSGSFDKLNTPDFSYSQAYINKKPWQIGPFMINKKLTFHQPKQWNDPWDIGWKGGFLFNPTIIEKDDVLYLFYRSAPKKECLCSRIGLATYTPETGWTDFAENPILFAENDNELLSVEDPKIYKYDGGYILFFNSAYELSADSDENLEGDNFPHNIGCDINYALSSDLLSWNRGGLVVPYEISKHWAKAAVIARNEFGEAVRIKGKYMMFLSEGCGGYQHIGYSSDMINWEFVKDNYLNTKEYGKLHEVACAIVLGENLLLDFFYEDIDGNFKAAQAIYNINEPTKKVDMAHGGTLAWGGLLKYHEKWIFPQGWDAEDFDMDLFFYEEV